MDLKMFITTTDGRLLVQRLGCDPNNRYQKHNLIGDVYAGYMSGTNNWDGGTNPQIFAERRDGAMYLQRVVHQCHARLAATEVRPRQRFAQRRHLRCG
ncbi:MAG: hypothetical protein ACLRM8_06545 [Alistipes sp.]